MVSTVSTTKRSGHVAALLGALAAALLVALSLAATARAEFGFEPGSVFAKQHAPVSQAPPLVFVDGLGIFPGPTADVWDQNIADAPELTQAGAHPDFSTKFSLNTVEGSDRPDGYAKEITVDTPPGFVGNAGAVPRCTTADFHSHLFGGCAPSTQVGVARVRSSAGQTFSPVYNLEPGPDAPARMAFKSLGPSAILEPGVRSDGDYGLRVTIGAIPLNGNFSGSTVTLWGVPHDPVHDIHRLSATRLLGGSILGEPEPFLTSPTDCNSGPQETTIQARSRPLSPHEPEAVVQESVPFSEPTGCDQLFFGVPGAEVSLTAQPTHGRADSPTGLDVNLSVPYTNNTEELANPTLRDVEVTLPEGTAINPAAANGLGVCSEAQIGLKSLALPTCPASSKLGTVQVDTPLLEDPMKGAVYQAAQDANPFGSTFAIYVAAKGPGVQIKLAGKIEPDPVTGQLTSTFEDNPQLPFTNFNLRFFGGPQAALVNPPTCGVKTTAATVTPWSAPDSGPPAQVSDSFAITEGPDGGACAASLAARPFEPTMSAGARSAFAREFSPFVLRLQRPDGHQEILTTDVAPPAGVTAKLAGVPKCASAGAAAGVCPESSRIGTVLVGAGAGSDPFFIQPPNEGKVFLSGPYDPDGAGPRPQAPLSALVQVPAVAGPFDLGVVNVRAAAYVDPVTAQMRVVSGPMPQILEGVPLRVRDIRVLLDRDEFTLSPSDCSAKQVDASVMSVHGQTAELSSDFQVAGCSDLSFAPRLGLALKGRRQMKTGGHPAVRAVVRQQGVGEAGVRRARVALPKSLALDPDNANALCEFEDGTKPDLENHCPAGSKVGRARAVTPLLDRPLAGDVFFVKNIRIDPDTGNEIRTLPMIVVALRGEIDVNLTGESSTTKNGRLVNTFAGVPDQPISRFNLNIKGGRNGILAVTRTRRSTINLCKAGRQVARTGWRGHNNALHRSGVRVRVACATRRQRKLRAAKRRAAHRAARGSASS
jgi:hypothetical protein